MPAAFGDELAAERVGVVGKLNNLDIHSLSWAFFAANWTSQPSLVGSTASGDVYSYVFNGVTRYRLVPSSYNPTQDAFYSGWDGSSLSGLIVKRG